MGALLDSLPTGGTSADVRNREARLLQLARQGQLVMRWAAVDYQENGHRLSFLVTTDGIKLEGVRLSMSATLSQQIADIYGAVLPTPKLADIVYRSAGLKLHPITRTITASMAGVLAQNDALEKAIGEFTGLVSDVGKNWVLVNALVTSPKTGTVAANYGWHTDTSPWAGVHTDPAATFPTTPGQYVIQSVGTVHDRWHADYSQVQTIIAQECTYDGQTMDIRDLMQSRAASILSTEGALKTVRQPGVPEESPGGAGPVPGGGAGGPSSSFSPKSLAGEVAVAALLGFGGALGAGYAARWI